MDQSEVQGIVEEHIEEMMEDLGVPHWRVSVDYGRCTNDMWEAESLVKPEYFRIMITINHDLMGDRTQVLTSLRHELLHAVCAPMYVLRELIDIEEDERNQERNHRAWTFCIEQMVAMLEKGLAKDVFYPEEET